MYLGHLLETNSNSAGWLLSIPNSFLLSYHLPHLRETKGSIVTFDFVSIPVHRSGISIVFAGPEV